MTNPMLALAVAQGEGLIDRAMVARVTRARLLAGVPRARREMPYTLFGVLV